jgi:serine/threonine-protein kinase/endoribonuclease IRE1
MGLGKQLVGQSSYGASLLNSSLRIQSNGGASSVIGAKGTVGWQAPEVMALRGSTDLSIKSDGSNGLLAEATDSSSPNESPCQSIRTSRSVDIFSLGCIFYCTIIPGSHPYGEWYEREANIMHNRPNLEQLRQISPEAFDIVGAMLQRNPKSRPTATEICNHPFFWSSDRKLSFVCEFSDRIEIEASILDGKCIPLASVVVRIERNASEVVGKGWDKGLHNDLLNNVQRFRTYDTSSVRDLLRLIRNKHHHFDELPVHVKDMMGSNTSGLMDYFESKFPQLVIHCFNICREFLATDDLMAIKYLIKPVRNRSPIRVETTMSSKLDKNTEPFLSHNVYRPEHRISVNSMTILPEENNDAVLAHLPSLIHDDMTPVQALDQLCGVTTSATISIQQEETLMKTFPSNNEKDGGTVIRYDDNSTASMNCRGWYCHDDDWVRSIDCTARKHDINLLRCAEDPKFRTRLCNHWDVSLGITCPMRKKNKCVFAHGPVELRVKEGKRTRWGKLVDDDGNCNNPKHSGGEDTYGAARSIECERRDEGKWSVNKSHLSKKKSTPKKQKSVLAS